MVQPAAAEEVKDATWSELMKNRVKTQLNAFKQKPFTGFPTVCQPLGAIARHM